MMPSLNRYPVITFKENAIRVSSVGLVVEFDAWLTFTSGAMANKVSTGTWMLTTGLPLESVVGIRDSPGGYFNCATLGTLTWMYLSAKPVKPIQPGVKGTCEVPSPNPSPKIPRY